MVKIRPFRAYVAHSEYAEEISIPSNHSISVKEGSSLIRRNRISFYKVDRPEFEMSSIVKSHRSGSVSSDSNSFQSKEEEAQPKKSGKVSDHLKTMSSKKEDKQFKRQITDFSKKYDGYEKNMNLKETGQEYREEKQGVNLEKVQKEMDANMKGASKLVKQTTDDIDVRSQKTLDKTFVQTLNTRKTSEKILDSTQVPEPEITALVHSKSAEGPELENDEDTTEMEYKLGHKNLNELIQKQLYRYHDKENFYLYVMKDNRRKNSPQQVGLICTVHYDEYKSKNIKIHEKTLTTTIARLKKLYCALGAYTGFPILFAEFGDLYEKIHKIASNDKAILKATMEGVDHKIFKLPKGLDTETLIYFEAIKHIYVADGHHRLKAYSSLIDSIHDESNKEFSLESIFVKDPNTLPVICKGHSKALIEKSMSSEENKKRVKNRKISSEHLSLIIFEKEESGSEPECKPRKLHNQKVTPKSISKKIKSSRKTSFSKSKTRDYASGWVTTNARRIAFSARTTR